jgi:hypothetical protein
MTTEQTYRQQRRHHTLSENPEKNKAKGTLTSNPELKKETSSMVGF